MRGAVESKAVQPDFAAGMPSPSLIRYDCSAAGAMGPNSSPAVLLCPQLHVSTGGQEDSKRTSLFRATAAASMHYCLNTNAHPHGCPAGSPGVHNEPCTQQALPKFWSMLLCNSQLWLHWLLAVL
jgi:hypothetical protein